MAQQHDFLDWYEASLPAHERKNRGHFSTPPQLVEQILDTCGYTPDHNLSRLRILDPACGSGNFLTQATRRLILADRAAGSTDRVIARHIQRNIWGFDPDPVACFLAEMQMHAACQELHLPDHLLRQPHIHQADGLAFPWSAQKPNIDLFVANPPYLAAKNTDLSGYRSTHQRGQADSYLLFLSLALQVVRSNGWIALVLPDPVLARANATRERERLLKETTLHHLWHLADVFTAYVGAVVLIAQKRPPSSQHAIAWKRERWHYPNHPNQPNHQQPTTGATPQPTEQNTQQVSQRLLQHQPGTELRYLLSTTEGTLLHRIYTRHRTFLPSSPLASRARKVSGNPLSTQLAEMPLGRTLANLGEFVLIRRGEELGKDSHLLLESPPEQPEQRYYPLLRGGIDIRPYHYPTTQRWITEQHIMKPLTRYIEPKILLVKSVGSLQATLDIHGHVVLQTLYILQLNQQHAETHPADVFSDEDTLYFLLAFLNSRLLQKYVYVLYTAYKLVQPQIEQHVLAHLPIPLVATTSEKAQIIETVRQLMDACSESSGVVELQTQSQKLYEKLEHMIYALYEKALRSEQDTQQILLPTRTMDKGVSLYG